MRLISYFFKKNTLYLPDCTTYYKNKDGFELYKKIFSRLGINFTTFDKNICTGFEIFELGYENEARKIAKDNFSKFADEKIKYIITNSPGAYKFLSSNYREFLPNWNIEVLNTWDIILQKLLGKHHLIINKQMEQITYHDSCYLGRYNNMYKEPRKILEAIGYEIKELEYSKEDSFCCGSCGQLPTTNNDLANKIARDKILQAKRTGVKKIIVCCFDNYNLLKDNSKDTGIEVLELSEVLAYALNIEKPNIIKEEEIEMIRLIETESNSGINKESGKH